MFEIVSKPLKNPITKVGDFFNKDAYEEVADDYLMKKKKNQGVYDQADEQDSKQESEMKHFKALDYKVFMPKRGEVHAVKVLNDA